jgi:DNA-binding MarR family transcriptional regulator
VSVPAHTAKDQTDYPNVCAKTSVDATLASALLFAPMQTTGVTNEQLADMMSAFMATAMKGSQANVFHVVEELDLSMTQFKILHILDGIDRELTPSELAQFVGLSPAATGRAVDALVRAGLVTRRDDDADRRVKRLTLTPTGTTAVNRITKARLEALANTVSVLDADQRDALAAALAPLLPDHLPDGVCGSRSPTQEAPPA